MRVAVFLLASFLSGAAEPVFELHGQLSRNVTAVAALHAANSPFTATSVVGPGGRFVFKNLEPGPYTLSIFIARSGTVQQTVHVGPGAADKKGRVRVPVPIDDAPVIADGGARVTAAELAIPAAARREYAQALKRLTKRDTSGAIQRLERAVEIAPGYASAWNHLGTIAYQTRQYEQAEQHFRQALEADSGVYEPVVNLGGVLIALKRYHEALDYNSEAVKRRPSDALAHSQLGMTYLRLGRLSEAETHLLLAIRLDPKHFSTPQFVLAELYFARQEKARAAEQLSELLKHHPDFRESDKVRETILLWRR